MNIRIYKFDAVESYFAKHIIVYLKMKDYCNEYYSPRKKPLLITDVVKKT